MKLINGFDNYYITEDGKVFTNRITHIHKYGDMRRLKTSINGRGYVRVSLKDKRNKTYTRNLHRLLAETFLGATKDTLVTHIDGNLKNNKLENLLCTNRSDICIRAFKRGRKKIWLGKHGNQHPSCKRAVCQIKNGVVVNIFDSIADAERETGISRDRIIRICSNKYQGHYKIRPDDYIWKYKEVCE